MVNLLPHLIDMPMSLGDHLEELRRRLIVPLVALFVFFIASFAYNGQLKVIFIRPILVAIDIIGEEKAKAIGLEKPKDPTDLSKWRPLTAFSISESAMVSVSVSFYAAFAATIPVLVYQIWRFVAVGLLAKERQLAFLFVPAGIMFFYTGALLGYYWGLPYYYAWMLEWNANDPVAKTNLGEAYYLDSFTMMTVCAGVVMDIPWLVMVLVRIGLVTPDQLARWRKLVVMINTVIASVITPPDGSSMVAMLIPLQLLFEMGLLASRAMMWFNRRADARAVLAEEKAAAEAHASGQQAEHGNAHQGDHAIEHAADHPADHPADHATDHGADHATDHATDHGAGDQGGHASGQGADQGQEHAADHPAGPTDEASRKEDTDAGDGTGKRTDGDHG